MTSKPKKKSDGDVIHAGTSLTIETISELRNKFLDAFHTKDEISVESGIIEDIDLNGIQFLVYLKRWDDSKKIRLNLDISFSDNSIQLLNRTGFGFLINTR
jgi:hypothetical protein